MLGSMLGNRNTGWVRHTWTLPAYIFCLYPSALTSVHKSYNDLLIGEFDGPTFSLFYVTPLGHLRSMAFLKVCSHLTFMQLLSLGVFLAVRTSELVSLGSSVLFLYFKYSLEFCLWFFSLGILRVAFSVVYKVFWSVIFQR